MNALNAVITAAERSGVKTTEIGPKMGKSYSYIAASVSRNSVPKADSIAAMLNVCGYVLCAVPKGKVPKSAIVIDPK